MANDEKSFNELLGEAPLAANTDTLTVVGALSRASAPDKFVLTLADGRTATLDTKAVKSHTRLGGAVGQVLVQLELDAKLAPKDLVRPESFPHTIAWFDPKSPITDTAHATDLHTIVEGTGLYDPILKPPSFDGTGVWDTVGGATLAEQIGPVGPGPVFGGGVAVGGVAPFALATPHQASAETLAAMMQFGGLGGTPLWLDRHNTAFWLDKRPQTDGTFPGHPSTWDF